MFVSLRFYICLLCFTVLGCPCDVGPDDFPLEFNYFFTLKNNSDQEIHIFLDREETGFDPSNKVEAGKSRNYHWEQTWHTIADKREITVNAGRDGNVLDAKIIPIAATDSNRSFTVSWDGYGLY